MFVALAFCLSACIYCSDQQTLAPSIKDLQLLTQPQKKMYEHFLKNKNTIDHAHRFAQNCIEFAKEEQKTTAATQLATIIARTIYTEACKHVSTLKK